jgi:hypothetical protein
MSKKTPIIEQEFIRCNKCGSYKIKVMTNKTMAAQIFTGSLIFIFFVVTIPITVGAWIFAGVRLMIPMRKAHCQDCKNLQNISKEQLQAFESVRFY